MVILHLRAHLIGNQYIKKEKRESLYLSSVPHCEALVLPISVERTTQKPHAEHICTFITPSTHVLRYDCAYTIHMASTVVSFLTEIEIYQISQCQERAFSNAFKLCPQTSPQSLG